MLKLHISIQCKVLQISYNISIILNNIRKIAWDSHNKVVCYKYNEGYVYIILRKMIINNT